MRENYGTELRGQLMRAAADFCLAMVFIWLVSLAESFHHGKTFFELSLSVAAIVAVDLAFLRHLRRVYAAPRRGVWRKD